MPDCRQQGFEAGFGNPAQRSRCFSRRQVAAQHVNADLKDPAPGPSPCARQARLGDRFPLGRDGRFDRPNPSSALPCRIQAGSEPLQVPDGRTRRHDPRRPRSSGSSRSANSPANTLSSNPGSWRSQSDSLGAVLMMSLIRSQRVGCADSISRNPMLLATRARNASNLASVVLG